MSNLPAATAKFLALLSALARAERACAKQQKDLEDAREALNNHLPVLKAVIEKTEAELGQPLSVP